jgi:hypothetical protein
VITAVAVARRLGALLAVLASAACTTLPGETLPSADAACRAWTQQLDAAVAQAGVADAEAERIPGVAGLRVDRVGEALRERAAAGGPAFAAWLQRAAALDAAARAAEIANLPGSAWPLPGAPVGASGRDEALARSADCRRQQLQALQQASPAQREALLARARVPDRYSLGLRTLGLYPLARWPFYAGVRGWQREHEAAVARWARQPPPLARFVPAAAEPSAPLPGPLAVDALGLPQPTPDQARRLLAWHAPVFEIEQRGPYDHFGSPSWAADGRLRVDGTEPVVFQRISHMRLGGRWRLQLVHTLWFPERPARRAFDILAGTLDGVVVRQTLDEQGRVLLVDSIHACGCYHLFFPSAALRPRTGAPRTQEWLFAPAPLPALGADDRLVVRLSTASHDVLGLQPLPRAQATGLPYRLQDEDALRSLPVAGGAPQRRSLYGPDGLVRGSERGERFLFWPMGIASAGAMRQWGHHATAFVGRRHFDDADLLERRFESTDSPPEPPPAP